MSIMLMSRIFRMNIGGCNRKLLAVRLADFADDDGRGIYPGVERLAAETELSERTVQRILADFCREGILVCRQRASGRPGVANRYDFDLAALKAVEDGKASPQTGDTLSPVENGERGDNPAERGDTGDRDGCHRDTRTVIEPPLEPSTEREGEREAQEGSQEPTGTAQTETRSSIERSFWRLVKGWPGFDGMPKSKALAVWFKLSPEERQQAADRFEGWLALLKAQKKSHVPAPTTYFAERLWTGVPDKSGAVSGPKIAAPYGKLWMAERLADLLRRPYGVVGALTTFDHREIELGKKTAEAIYREKIRRSGWTIVNTMHERATEGKGYPCRAELLPIAEGFRQADRDGAVYAAWRREHERRGWPFLDHTRPPEHVWFPALPEGWETDPDAAVWSAMEEFAARVREVKGDEHAA